MFCTMPRHKLYDGSRGETRETLGDEVLVSVYQEAIQRLPWLVNQSRMSIKHAKSISIHFLTNYLLPPSIWLLDH